MAVPQWQVVGSERVLHRLTKLHDHVIIGYDSISCFTREDTYATIFTRIRMTAAYPKCLGTVVATISHRSSSKDIQEPPYLYALRS